MSFSGIVVGNYGQVGQLTINDTDTDAAADVSAYTTSQHFIFRDPDGNEETKAASFATDGSDGIVEYTLAEGDIDEPGKWKVRGKVVSSSAVLYSEWHEFEVLA